MVNALHLSTAPGVSLVKQMGGIHGFMGWTGPVATDSGGFQVLSLISDRSASGKVTREGFSYRSGKARKRRLWTPEKCIQQQLSLGADICFCLDHCTHPDQPDDLQAESVANTVGWARRCREEFERRTESIALERRPLLFAVVQGGESPDLRRQCAEALIEIGFDGYGYGGWPVGSDGEFVDSVGLVADLVPRNVPRHALGVGKPENVVRAFHMGYDTFDCVLPTRDARQKRLSIAASNLATDSLSGSGFYRYLYIEDERFARDNAPVDPDCDCPCCRRYTRAYLHHLFQAEIGVASRLATIHNLAFYARLMARLRKDRAARGSSR